MANTDRPTGLTPVRTTQGNPYSGQLTKMTFLTGDSTAAYIGDVVQFGGSASTAGIPEIIQSAAGNENNIGVIVALEPNYADLTVLHRVASTERIAYVCTDREMLYEIQEDSVGGALALTDIGSTADFVVAAGSTVSGRSAMELDSSDADSSAGSLLIMELVQRDDNAIGTNAKFLVKIVEHEFDTATGV